MLMELKSIEMQIALPKSIDASKQTQSIQQEGQLQVDQAMAQMEKELIEKRQNVIRNEQKDGVLIKKDQENNSSRRESKKKKKKKFDSENHPYKGKNIDFSG